VAIIHQPSRNRAASPAMATLGTERIALRATRLPSSDKSRSLRARVQGCFVRYTSSAAQLTLDLPDELSAALAESGGDLSRAALEAIALESYREGKLSAAQLRQVLGYKTRMDVDGFLKKHGVELEYTFEDLERDRSAHRRLAP
jgi:hypothetical protein